MLYSIERTIPFTSVHYSTIYILQSYNFEKKRFSEPINALIDQYLIESQEQATRTAERVRGIVVEYNPVTRMFIR
jgi:hypothetical protein